MMIENAQWRSNAAAGLCSSGSSTLEDQNRCLSQAYGVTVLLAKKSEKGKMPSLAISCFTVEANKD